MTDKQAIEQALEAFHNLSDEDTAKLKEFNTRIQNHKGTWSTPRNNNIDADGNIELPLKRTDPLAYEFMDFACSKDLLAPFNCTGDDEISKLFVSEGLNKYDNVDLETVLKLLYIVNRKERFSGGALVWAFESGGFPKLVNRLVELKQL